MKMKNFSIFILTLLTQNTFAQSSNWYDSHTSANDCSPGMELDITLSEEYYDDNCKAGVVGAHIAHCCKDTVCLDNTYVDGSHTCADCPAGTHRTNVNLLATIKEEVALTACPVTTCGTTQRTVNGVCVACAAGAQMSSSTNAYIYQDKECDQCQEDHYWTTGSVSSTGCDPCPLGEYVNASATNNAVSACSPHDCGGLGKGVSNYDCVSCNNGYVQLTTTVLNSNIITGEQECEYCAANYYADNGICVACASSERKLEATVKNSDDSKCDICKDRDYFVATINATTGVQGCFKCPINEVGIQGDLVQPFNPNSGGTEESETSCIEECEYGSQVNGTSGECVSACGTTESWVCDPITAECECKTKCDVDKYIVDNTCTSCPKIAGIDSVRKADEQAQGEELCALSTSTEREAAVTRGTDLSDAATVRAQNFDIGVATYQGHNDLPAYPYVSSNYNSQDIKDGSEVYTVDFGTNVYTVSDFTAVGVAKIKGQSADEVTLTDSNGVTRTGQLCFEPGNRDVMCGVGFNCANGADTNSADCISHGSTWNSTHRTSTVTSASNTCATLQQALDDVRSFVGILSGDSRADNLDKWRRQVTFAFCEKIPSIPSTTVTTAQYGADTSINLEENKCHVMKPVHGNIIDPTSATGGAQACAGDVLDISGTECNFKCDDNYSLDRSTICTADKILRAGTCTLVDGDAGADQMKPDTTDSDIGPQNNQEGDNEINPSDNLEDMNENTQYSDDTLGPYDGTTDYATAAGTLNDLPGNTAINAPKCRFLPPNRIFPDALVQGQEYNSDSHVSAAGTVEDHASLDNNFHADDTDVDYGTNNAKVRVRFNKDALTVDAENSYKYYIIHSTTGSTEDRVLDTYNTALKHDLLLTLVTIDASSEPTNAPATNDNNHFAMDHEGVTINPNDCLYDENNTDTIQTCRPTASIKFWKRYQVVIGAASKCAGPTWSNKEHVFIRATYTVDSEFELKYAPGLNLGPSGFREIKPGVWVRNRISSSEPTLIMHSDYSKTMVNVAKASTTVTHASLDAFTRLELVDPVADTTHDPNGADGPSANTTTHEQFDNSGNSADQDDGDYTNTGMCRDSHVQGSHVSGFDTGQGDDGDNSIELHDTVGCLFRARMVVQQNAESNLAAGAAIMKSTLAGYRLDLSMSQYAQYNFAVLSGTGLAELQSLSSTPANFADVISDPSIANQNDPNHPAFGSDIRFDICSCNVRYRQVNAGSAVTYATTSGRYEQTNIVALSQSNTTLPSLGRSSDTCGYNANLNTYLKAERGDGRGLVDYTHNSINIDGFVTSGYVTEGVDTVAPVSLADAAKQTGGAAVSGFTYVKQFVPDVANNVDGGIGAACTYEAFFPPGINTPFAYVRAWFKFSESTHIDQVDHDQGADAQNQDDVNTNPTQWSGTDGDASNGNSATDTPARRLRSLAKKTQLKAPPNVQHSVHFKFK